MLSVAKESFLHITKKCYIFVKSVITMRPVTRIQTAFRFEAELLERMKWEAKKRNISLNKLVEDAMEQAFRPELPAFTTETPISDEIRQLHCLELKRPTEEEFAADPRLEYLWKKHVDY